MDALTSQASIAGYEAVIIAASRINRIVPMMMTPSGTIAPVRFFIVGAGVAGLQAIATAKRLGGRVEAYDIRPETAEQISSLGAKAITLNLGETSQTKDGYAKGLSDEQLKIQHETLTKVCATADIIITTAQVFGKRAPRIISNEMLTAVRPGSVIVDMAVHNGGNVEASQKDQEIELNGVRIIGHSNLAGQAAFHASQMYAANLYYMFKNFWDQEKDTFELDPEDDILKACLVTKQGQVINQEVKRRLGNVI